MYTIKQAAARAGVTVPVMRAWERRYGIVAPSRTPAGYRLYDDLAIERVRAMRALVRAGWQPSIAAHEVLERGAAEALAAAAPGRPAQADERGPESVAPPAYVAAFVSRFIDAAAALDDRAVADLLDETLAQGSFEVVATSLLFPALAALGEAWADGRVGVAGEHMTSHMVLRRFGAALDATGHRRERTESVLVGLPAGSHHELGALAFAIAARRAGLPVTYLGPNLPRPDWVDATEHARVAVVGVVTPADRPATADVVRGLRSARPELRVAVGGRAAEPVDGAILLPNDLDGAVRTLQSALRPSDLSPSDPT